MVSLSFLTLTRAIDFERERRLVQSHTGAELTHRQFDQYRPHFLLRDVKLPECGLGVSMESISAERLQRLLITLASVGVVLDMGVHGSLFRQRLSHGVYIYGVQQNCWLDLPEQYMQGPEMHGAVERLFTARPWMKAEQEDKVRHLLDQPAGFPNANSGQSGPAPGA